LKAGNRVVATLLFNREEGGKEELFVKNKDPPSSLLL
jgi:hypothetical protein